MANVELPDDLFARLQALAVPLVDSSADVISRLLDHYEKTSPQSPKGNAQVNKGAGLLLPQATVSGRVPRERGATLQIEGHPIHAVSVRDMYEQVLRFIVDNGHSERMEPLLPFRTSKQRYLVAKHPKHPNGNDFLIRVQYGGYCMEAHKDYKNAVKHLGRFVAKLGLKLRYLG